MNLCYTLVATNCMHIFICRLHLLCLATDTDACFVCNICNVFLMSHWWNAMGLGCMQHTLPLLPTIVICALEQRSRFSILICLACHRFENYFQHDYLQLSSFIVIVNVPCSHKSTSSLCLLMLRGAR